MRIAIIPARGGSKRIVGKNIIPFCGQPMLSYALNAASMSGLFDKIHVSTDSEEISRTAADLGFKPDFLRISELADDFTGIVPVLRWVVEEYCKRGECYLEVCCIMPNAPLLTADDLLQAFRIFETQSRRHPLLVFTKYPVPVEWAFRRNLDGTMRAISSELLNSRSQDLEDAYYECGPFTFWTTAQLKPEKPLADGVLSYILPKERAVDIDTPEDLAYAERLFQLLHRA